MKLRGEVEFELTDKQAESVTGGGIWLSAFLHDEIDIAFNCLRKSDDYKVVGIRVEGSSSGTLAGIEEVK